MDGILAYKVDVQKDFMYMSGALPVSGVLYRILAGEKVDLAAEGNGAEQIIPVIASVETYFKNKKTRKAGSVDRHFKWELKKSPEFLPPAKGGQGFPEHCMDGTEGQLNISEAQWHKPVYVEHQLPDEKVRAYTGKELEKIVAGEGDIVFEKQNYDVFTNPQAEKVLEKLGVKKAFVYGVATDWCVKAAVIGMCKRGIEVYVIKDATYAVNATKTAGAEAFEEMKKSGAKFIESGELDSILGD